MKLQKVSRLFVSIVLFAACVVLVLLSQAQSGGGGADLDLNKCHTEWDFCNAGSEAENAYHWRLGWCVAAVESGAASVSVSACMGQEEGTVSYPRSLSPASSSSGSSMPEGAQPNKCYTEWDFCNAGTEAENAYFWRLGWYSEASERGEVSVSLQEFMGGEPPAAPIIRRTKAAPRPDETQDLPWGRAYCLLTYPSNHPVIEEKTAWFICGWDATLPPGMECAARSTQAPWHCTSHGPLGSRSLTRTAEASN